MIDVEDLEFAIKAINKTIEAQPTTKFILCNPAFQKVLESHEHRFIHEMHCATSELIEGSYMFFFSTLPDAEYMVKAIEYAKKAGYSWDSIIHELKSQMEHKGARVDNIN